jgi:hypothetical protein
LGKRKTQRSSTKNAALSWPWPNGRTSRPRSSSKAAATNAAARDASTAGGSIEGAGIAGAASGSARRRDGDRSRRTCAR